MRFLLLALMAFTMLGHDNSARPYPAGCYLYFSELREKKPSVTCKLKLAERSEGAIALLGGNDFKLVDTAHCMGKYSVTDLWAYCDTSGLYINCKKLQKEKQSGYARVLTFGRYLAFYHNPENTNTNVVIAGLLGGGIGAGMAAAAAEPPHSDLYVIDLTEGKLYWVDKDFIKQRLLPVPDLRYSFLNHRYNDSIYVQLQYLDSLNMFYNTH